MRLVRLGNSYKVTLDITISGKPYLAYLDMDYKETFIHSNSSFPIGTNATVTYKDESVNDIMYYKSLDKERGYFLFFGREVPEVVLGSDITNKFSTLLVDATRLLTDHLKCV